MAYSDLATQVMISITFAMLSPEHQRNIIERSPRLAPLLGDLGKAHGDLVIFQNVGRREHPAIAALKAKTSALDNEHDALARGMHHLLLGLSEICRARGFDDPYMQLRAELLPKGLDINLQSYLLEAGDAELREGRLSEESKRVLEATIVRAPAGEASLREVLDMWNEVARALGDAESEKARVRGEEPPPGSRGPARRAWARIMTLFVAMVALETGLDDQDRRALLEPLQTADAKATKKKMAALKKGLAFDPDAEEEAAESREGDS